MGTSILTFTLTMGNTSETAKPEDSSKGTPENINTLKNSTDHQEQHHPIGMRETNTYAFPHKLGTDASLQTLLSEIASQIQDAEPIQRANCIKKQIGFTNDFGVDPHIKYYRISDCNMDAPKTRANLRELNIKPKNNVEEVPPRRRNRRQNRPQRQDSSNLSQSSEIRNMVRNFEADIEDLNNQSLRKCNTIADPSSK